MRLATFKRNSARIPLVHVYAIIHSIWSYCLRFLKSLFFIRFLILFSLTMASHVSEASLYIVY